MACPICAWSPGSLDYPLLYETRLWRVVLAPNQCLVGRCVIHLKRHAVDLADLTEDEMLEWLTVVRTLDSALRSAFQATMFNWSCYMNLSYREPVPDPHIHWWAVPRYNHPVIIDEWTFQDPDFGSPYDHTRRLDAPPEIRQQIAERIQQAIAAPGGKPTDR